MVRKPTFKYYFSVEGETERLYLKRIQHIINNHPQNRSKVNFDIKVEQNPLSRVKGLNNLGEVKITHLVDIEGQSDEDHHKFKHTLKKMKEAKSLGKKIVYNLAYSNYTFELWILLHKIDCYQCMESKHQYLELINQAFSERFAGLGEFKKESNLQRILETIDFHDVQNAIMRAKNMESISLQNGLQRLEYCGYAYFLQNPATSIWHCIEQILMDCELFRE